MRTNMFRAIFTFLFFSVMFPVLAQEKIVRAQKEILLAEIKRKIYDESKIVDKKRQYTSIFSNGDILYQRLKAILRPNNLDPIDIAEADMLFDNAVPKLRKLQQGNRDLNRQLETRSILVSVDKLKELVDSLATLQIITGHKTGVRVVFGSYPFESGRTEQEKSGRLTVFFVGTMDTIPSQTFTPGSHRDMTLFKPQSQVGLIIMPRNHGDLCPNACDSTNTRYKD